MSLPLLLAQILAILIAARACGWLFRRIGQPQVVGEMAAGLMLGPSLLGRVAPESFASLFPATGLGQLHAISQLGLILFMFLLGTELDTARLRQNSRLVLTTSCAGIALPFVLGTALGYMLHAQYAPAGVPLWGFACFIGTAMSMTALPVLARILKEQGLEHSASGQFAIACAVIGDVATWALLAVVIVLFNPTGAALPLWLGSALFVAFMFGVLRPLLARYAGRLFLDQSLCHNRIAVIFTIMLLSALAAELLGLHALIGAFIAGVVLPRNAAFSAELRGKFEDLTTVLLLPLFFAYTGLRTQIDLAAGFSVWGMTLAVVAIAMVGKMGGAFAAARLGGMPQREATIAGVLLNTRGLMELVILNIGMDLGLLSPPVFAAMVIMAFVTTLMTAPLLRLLHTEAGELKTTGPNSDSGLGSTDSEAIAPIPPSVAGPRP